MAAAVRNNVWVAPGQDAQFLHKTAPLTADGLRGVDHGQVLCNTRDAIPETSSFHDNNLVGDYIFFSFASIRASQCLLMPLWCRKMLLIKAKQAVFIKDAGLILKEGL